MRCPTSSSRGEVHLSSKNSALSDNFHVGMEPITFVSLHRDGGHFWQMTSQHHLMEAGYFGNHLSLRSYISHLDSQLFISLACV